MLQKNIEKKERAKRLTWCGYYPRRTPTKREKEIKIQNKHKERKDD